MRLSVLMRAFLSHSARHGQAKQLREERARGAGLQRGLAKALHTAERERAAASVAASRALCGPSFSPYCGWAGSP